MVGDSAFLRQLFDTAVLAASPQSCMSECIADLPAGKLVVFGAGKAAASMASEIENARPEDVSGLVIVPYGHGLPCHQIEVVEAAHPIPDKAGVGAACRMLELAYGLTGSDQVIFLISGGGSSLLSLPIDGVSLEDKQGITRALLRSGAAIADINCVRKQLSAIKGGKFAAACSPATIRTIAISDVPGNDASLIASGPTMRDASTPDDALAILERFSVEAPESVRSALRRPAPPAGCFDEDVRIIATSDSAIAAAANLAEQHGYTTMVLGDLEGDARELAKNHASLAIEIANGDKASALPLVILSGGETTVELSGNGRGGRNGEYALALAISLDAHPGISAIACDTDGIDGSGDNAGCLVSPDALSRAAAQGIDARSCQTNNDSYSFFAALDDLVVTGPTRTNVNDFRAVFVR
jgi:glycerate 2-kinase